MTHKSGFVNIIGNPNVGKSTIMNALVGERLSIITSKSQTTRHRIMGIVNGDDFQIVYSDTPGVVKPSYKLQESMLRFASSALSDADIILYVTDTVEKIEKNEGFLAKVQNTDTPVILVINKIDLTEQEELETLVAKWQEILPNAIIFPVSALSKFRLDYLLSKIKELLPEGEPFFPKDQLTDKSERFFVSEIIREKILRYYQKEIPYSVEIEVESFVHTEKVLKIGAVIYVARDSQKGIIIGSKGAAIKKTGTMARKDMEVFFDKKVFLELFVKVSKDWRNNDRQLKSFGYDH